MTLVWLGSMMGRMTDFPLLRERIQPAYLLEYLSRQIASGYVWDLSSYCLIADSLTSQEPDALRSLLHTLHFTLSHSNSLTLRTLEAEPRSCGRKSRFCSSLVTSWFRLLLAQQQGALPSSITKAYDCEAITRQALLAAFSWAGSWKMIIFLSYLSKSYAVTNPLMPTKRLLMQ